MLNEAEITEGILRTSKIVAVTESLARLTASLQKTNQRALASFCAMLTVVGLSAIINNPEIGMATSLSLAGAAGAILGDTFQPVSRIMAERKKGKTIRALTQEGNLLPDSLVSFLSGFRVIVPPGEVTDWLRLSERVSKDSRIEVAQAMLRRRLSAEGQNGKSPSPQKEQKRERRKERREVVAVFMEEQRLAQIKRRSLSFRLREFGQRLLDWGSGLGVFGALTYFINIETKNSLTGGLIGLLDDIFALGTIFFSHRLKQFLRVISVETPRKGKSVTVFSYPIGPQKIKAAPFTPPLQTQRRL